MPVPPDLAGHPPFERLTAIVPAERPPGVKARGGRYWKCRCECGNVVVVSANRLTSGNTRSCGCLQREKASAVGKLASGHNRAATCQHAPCGAPFMATNRQRFCSRACKEASDLAPRSPATCGNPRCGAPIPAARSGQRFCSDRCRSLAKNPGLPPVACPICGAPVARRGRTTYCSADCRRVADSRSKHAAKAGSPLDQALAIEGTLRSRAGGTAPHVE